MSPEHFCFCSSWHLEAVAGCISHGTAPKGEALSECVQGAGRGKIVFAAGDCSGLLNGIIFISQLTEEDNILLSLDVSSGRLHRGNLASASTLAEVAPYREDAKKRLDLSLHASPKATSNAIVFLRLMQVFEKLTLMRQHHVIISTSFLPVGYQQTDARVPKENSSTHLPLVTSIGCLATSAHGKLC